VELVLAQCGPSTRARRGGDLTSRPPSRGQSRAAHPAKVLKEVRSFTELARSGAYIAGDRRVSSKERSGWRFTFGRLADDARRALTAQDSEPAEQAVADLVDLCCSAKDMEYFHSEDPVEAARFVVSDAVFALWTSVIGRLGLDEFTRRAMSQFIGWDARYGWTRTGYGRISEKETQLANVLARLLPTPDAWVNCAARYLEALDRSVARTREAQVGILFGSGSGFGTGTHHRSRRTADLSAWHDLLLDRLPDYDAGDRLDRLVIHPALGGPELLLLRARRARQTGEMDQARALAAEALETLPGHHELLAFAAEIDAELPERAKRVIASRQIS
jgi:hypothetical protein